MAEELERNGDKAIVDEDYDQAVSLYTQAITLDHVNASLYVSRAQAHIKLENYSDAVLDANRALELDPDLSKAHLRKGTALFNLEDYQSAKAAFEAGAAVDPNSPQLKLWIRKCDAELEAAAADKEGAGTGLSGTPSRTPMETVKDTVVPDVQATPIDTANGTGHDRQNAAECSAPAVSVPQLPLQQKYRFDLELTPPPRFPTVDQTLIFVGNSISSEFDDTEDIDADAITYKHEWYQTDTQAVVTVFAKNIKQDQLNVEFGEQTATSIVMVNAKDVIFRVARFARFMKPIDVSSAQDLPLREFLVVISRPDEEPFSLRPRLFGKIKPSESKYTILSTKVEIRLIKFEAVQWKGLEFDPALALVLAPSFSAPKPAAPKKPNKNWDKLEAEVKKAEKDEKLEGDAALNKLFQDIYSNADEDTRRAMNKSFVESNGTVLSTNWKEVGSKKVDGSPPKGMEMRKWEQ